jgi:hypothetical protein
MAIERKDRSFDHIFEEVSFERVPMDYVETLRIHMADGSTLDISQDEIAGAESEMDLLEGIERDDISDVAITLDYEGIKQDVNDAVKSVLDSFFASEK